MDLKKFLDRLPMALSGNLEHAIYHNMLNTIHAMSTPRVYSVLNLAVSCLEPGEIYLEIGTYQGGSLVAALHDNQAQAIACDNFSEFSETNSEERLLNNLKTFGVFERVTFFDQDSDMFLLDTLPSLEANIGVYYFDGAHGREAELNGLKYAFPHLKPGTIILVDDVSYSQVQEALNDFYALFPEQIRQILFINSPAIYLSHPDPIWWNGVCVLQKI